MRSHSKRERVFRLQPLLLIEDMTTDKAFIAVPPVRIIIYYLLVITKMLLPNGCYWFYPS